MGYDDFKAYQVEFVPTLVILQDSKEVLWLKGVPWYEEIKELLQYDQCVLPKEEDLF